MLILASHNACRFRASAVAVGLLAFLGCSTHSTGPPKSPAIVSETTAGSEPGFRSLSLDEFEVFQGKAQPIEPTWTMDGENIRCTGKPRGYLYSRSPYRDFTLRADLRYPADTPGDPDKANTGFFAYITEPHRVWPICLEVQGKQIEMGMIKGNGRPNPLDPSKVHDDEPARRKARRQVGEWNSIEIISRGGKLVSLLNGTKVSENDAGELREGPIGIQAEDYPYEIRNLRIKTE
jgi:hypothetical protein